MSALTREIIELAKTMDGREIYSHMRGRAAYRTVLDAITQGRLEGTLPKKKVRLVNNKDPQSVHVKLTRDVVARLLPEAKKRGMMLAGFVGLLVDCASQMPNAILDDDA